MRWQRCITTKRKPKYRVGTGGRVGRRREIADKADVDRGAEKNRVRAAQPSPRALKPDGQARVGKVGAGHRRARHRRHNLVEGDTGVSGGGWGVLGGMAMMRRGGGRSSQEFRLPAEGNTFGSAPQSRPVSCKRRHPNPRRHPRCRCHRRRRRCRRPGNGCTAVAR